jgi:SAM-dependent methyltransferase
MIRVQNSQEHALDLIKAKISSSPSTEAPLVNIKPAQLPTASSFRHVFQTTKEMKTEFAQFLNTIFMQLDEKKVFELMDGILRDETKTDETIYQELLEKIHTAKKPLAALSMLKALHVVRKGMGLQAKEHLKSFYPPALSNYLEIFNRRYLRSIEGESGLSFQKTAAVCDDKTISLKDRLEAGGLYYPYEKLHSLNDSDCKDPSLDIAKTYKPLGEEIPNESVDLISCLGGLHHIPEERLEPFVASMARVLKPGAVCLLRDHDAADEKIKAIAAVVHSFVNAVDGVSLEKESLEVRNFQPESYWTQLMERQGFTRIDTKSLILQDDPTRNAMMAFIKTPKNAEELSKAAHYQKEFHKSPTGSYATWIEWGNVRFSKSYAEFIQKHHSYAFDHIGHAVQHWIHFYQMMKASYKKEDAPISHTIFSDSMMMNLFILLGTTLQLEVSALMALPSQIFARIRDGKKWREDEHLSTYERFEAAFQKDYSSFIDYEPFFKYPYFRAIGNLWKEISCSKDSFFTKLGDGISAMGFTACYGAQAIASSFVNRIYYADPGSSSEETIHVLMEDPLDELDKVKETWDKEKLNTLYGDKQPFKSCEIKVLYSAEGKKLVSLPFYKPFTEIIKLFSKTEKLQLLKVGGEETITLDLLLNNKQKVPKIEGSNLLYQIKKLQDQEKKRYATYEVDVKRLLDFCKVHGVKRHLEYIHTHR